MKRFNNEVMLGGFIVAAGGLLAYMSMAVGGLNMTPGVHVKARFSNASGLVKDAAIAIAGVQVGHVESLGVEGKQAIVGLFIDRKANVRADVHAAIRAKSLLGEKYLELQPQSLEAPLLKEGDLIVDTRASIEIDEMMASLAPILKQVDPKDVATIVHTVAKTASEHGDDLGATIQHMAAISKDVGEIVAKNRNNVDRIASNVASITAEGGAMLKAKRPEIERTVTSIDHLTGTLNAEAPSFTHKAQRIASNVDGITARLHADAPKLATNLGKAADRLPGTLDDLAGLGKRVTHTIGKVDPLLDKANAFNGKKMHDLADDLMLHTGVKVYAQPFGAPDKSEWKKKSAD